ncbi:exonuclease/helicase [Pseudoneurospora amorphoporcata]|uniref:Exonuclease/helicase n=1 Tax=Pseudoneurospora amorphoporcata TaxID=241081 RepID=A0AAN6SCW6_9PEZI|nr:exonuclease/helicase [Pseudoneurospora amorphoporcata]
MRSPHPIPQAIGAGASAVNSTTSLSLRQCRHRPRFFASSPSSSLPSTPRYPVHLGAMERKDQTWNSSRGITFAGDSTRRVVGYPQLPSLARFHSDSAASTASNPEPVLPPHEATVPQGNPDATGTTLDSQGQVFVDAQEALEEQLEVIIADENVQSKDEGASLKPPFTPLSFTMSEDLFKKAKKAAEGTPESYWTYNLYRGPDKDGNMNEKVKVHYCRSANTTERVLKQYFMDDKILGLDLEWEANAKPAHGPRQNVSVIQIASEKRVGIFHISLYPKKDELGSPLLKQIIEDPEVIKTGSWILGDCTRLEKYLGIKGRGIQELSHLYKLVKYSGSGEHKLVNRTGVPLATMVQEILQLPMFKGSVRTSAWSRPLNMDQILYSASDAYAGVQLFAMMDHQRKQLNPTPPLPYAAELKMPIRLAADVILEEAGLLDEPLPDETVDAALSADYLSTVGNNINVEIEGNGSTTLSSEETKTTTLGSEETKTTTLGSEETKTIKKRTTKKTTTDSTAPTTSTTATATSTKRKRNPQDPSIPIDPLVSEATVWAQNYLLSRQPPRPKQPKQPKQPVTPNPDSPDSPDSPKTTAPRPLLSVAPLRAYYLWSRNPSLNCEALAALLGIKTSSAAGYILQAVKAERGRLGFEPKRMREEVLGCGVIAETTIAWRWKGVVQLCELYEAAERRLDQGEKAEVGKNEMEALDEIFEQDGDKEGEGEEVEVEEAEAEAEQAEAEVREEVKEESAEDVMKAALEAAEDLDFDEELNSSSQETVDADEAERLRKASRSH